MGLHSATQERSGEMPRMSEVRGVLASLRDARRAPRDVPEPLLRAREDDFKNHFYIEKYSGTPAVCGQHMLNETDRCAGLNWRRWCRSVMYSARSIRGLIPSRFGIEVFRKTACVYVICRFC
jgi:hypothetical protein